MILKMIPYPWPILIRNWNGRIKLKFSRRLNRYWFSFFWIYFENDVWEGGTVLVAKWGGWEMPEIKKTWLTFYGLSDHDFPIKLLRSPRRIRGFSGWFPFPLIRPSGTFSLEGKGFPLLLETVDSATPGKPCVQNDMGVGWEWKKNSLFEYTATKRHEKICSCSIFSTWINQNTLLVVSINNQCMQCQQLFQTASTSICR